MPDYEEMRNIFEEHGQGHIFENWGKLFQDQQEELLEDCAQVDFDWLRLRWAEFQGEAASVDLTGLVPAPVVGLPTDDKAAAEAEKMFALGEETLRAGKAAAFLVAGGQGTRLGYDGPKGCYPVGPISGKTLFQWHAEQILARSIRYGAAIPWYIMTSRDNDQATRNYFRDNNHLGLRESDVFFFQQRMVPSLDFQGKLMLATPSRLAMNPNGHGGSLSGLLSSGAVADMKKRGIEYISYFQVDNPLVTICDPLFIGHHVAAGAAMSSKVLEKASPAEKIGIACVRDGKTMIVEYSDLDEKTMREIGADGRLKFWAGSIAIHIINVDFVERVAADNMLPWHQARKKVAFMSGPSLVKPTRENAVKFETFSFDALPFAEKSVCLEVKREHEFAPVKNADGVDSVVSCRQLLSSYFKEWLAEAGIAVPVAENGGGPVVEISPLYGLDGRELAAKVKPEGFELGRRLLME